MADMKRLFAAALLLAQALMFCGCSKAGTATSASPMPAAIAAGMRLYNANCATCHGAKGQGQPGAFPPLDANSVVTGDSKALIHIIKLGLTGPVSVKGVTYNGQMPAWNAALSDAQIASVVTYIRGAWSNGAGPVTTQEVAAQK